MKPIFIVAAAVATTLVTLAALKRYAPAARAMIG
jgi:hypothetical protein